MSTTFLSLEVKAPAIDERLPQSLTGSKHKKFREPAPLVEQMSNLWPPEKSIPQGGIIPGVPFLRQLMKDKNLQYRHNIVR